MEMQEGRDAMSKEWNKLELPLKDENDNIIRPAAWDVTKVEPKGVVNTGNATSDLTSENDVWI